MTPQYLLPQRDSGIPVDDFYLFPQAFSPQEVDLIKGLKPKEMKAGTAGSVVDIKYRSSQVGWIGYGEQSSWLYEKLADLVMVANNRMWNCDIQSLSESIQYGTYPAQKNGHYDFHLDVGKAASARKLSTSLLISEPEVDYAGGQFEFLVGKVPKQVDLAAGSLVVFPSYLLHRVKPVTIGTRESLVTWVHGPAWK